LSYVDRTEYYDYGFQTFIGTKGVIKPGDRISTHCVYDSRTRPEETIFGTSSLNEMCLDFVMYYPRVPKFSWCGFGTDDGNNFTFCGSGQISQVSKIGW
jgi:hypothetical protein